MQFMKIDLKNPLQRRQVLVFSVGWLAYASTYCLRKPLGVVKTDLETELLFTRTQLGWLDTALLLPYAVMQMILGPLGDKFGPRKTFGVCLLLSSVSMITFGSWGSFSIFCFLLFLNGSSQAQCWPNAMKALGSWYPDSVRNTVFGLFGTCAFAGGIIGTSLAVWLQTSYGWRSAFLTPSLIVGALGILVLLFFQQPEEVNIEVPGKVQATPSKTSKTSNISTWELIKIPMLVEIAVAVFCLKAVRYCMYMWLPMYLLHQLEYTKGQAGLFSTMFEIGGVLGSAAIGFVLDRCFRGRPLLGTTFSAAASALSLFLFMVTGSWGVFFNMIFLFLAGAFNCGPDTILGGSIPAELGDADGRNAAAAAVGIVNGFGSVGTFLEGPIIGMIATLYGWSGMFYFMIVVTALGSFAVFRASVIYARQPKSIPDLIPLTDEEMV
ncbi:uncharacterized protein LOC127832346 [Dreissena polymorpha]|uniref:Major facilitator superfamily (MFS) profile domain-containing protein n=1 Tax=Dreissena polymorpha TaxID=45954 RepID=A0A9D4JUC1_DREPO|nr:uncharacterized protein LOC127832346 [Dreissena polymorpha]XP_052213729.1 uncharacterized protein LOC127832346 [Dreissena polymorpha]XP_052213730.1 uncharacterized protein LOC127832346 [Dreissena polymorpha]KAH3820537.1 hypothetical protein DPMN_122281 [Dreissena polymorpha]